MAQLFRPSCSFILTIDQEQIIRIISLLTNECSFSFELYEKEHSMINPKEFADSMLQIIKQRHANHENAKLQHEATDDCTIHDCFDCKKYFADHHRAQQVKDFFSYTSALLERIKTTLESNRPTDSELLLYSSALSRCSDAHMNMEAIKNAVDTNDGIDHYGGYDGCVAAFLAEFIEFFIHFDGIRSMGRVLENDQIPKL